MRQPAARFFADGLAALGAIHGHERCIRADVCCTSLKSTCRETDRERERERERERDVTVTRERFGMFIFLENTRPSLGTRGNWEWALPRSRPWHRYCLKSCAFSLYRDKKKKRKSTTRDSYDSYDSVSNFHVEKKHFSFANASSSSFSSRRKRQQSFLSVHLQFR